MYYLIRTCINMYIRIYIYMHICIYVCMYVTCRYVYYVYLKVRPAAYKGLCVARIHSEGQGGNHVLQVLHLWPVGAQTPALNFDSRGASTAAHNDLLRRACALSKWGFWKEGKLGGTFSLVASGHEVLQVFSLFWFICIWMYTFQPGRRPGPSNNPQLLFADFDIGHVVEGKTWFASGTGWHLPGKKACCGTWTPS